MDARAEDRGAAEALEEIRRRLAESDPDVLRAAAEVDRSLIASLLARSPLERLRLGAGFARGLSRFRLADNTRD